MIDTCPIVRTSDVNGFRAFEMLAPMATRHYNPVNRAYVRVNLIIWCEDFNISHKEFSMKINGRPGIAAGSSDSLGMASVRGAT
jgi:hypothetical protein